MSKGKDVEKYAEKNGYKARMNTNGLLLGSSKRGGRLALMICIVIGVLVAVCLMLCFDNSDALGNIADKILWAFFGGDLGDVREEITDGSASLDSDTEDAENVNGESEQTRVESESVTESEEDTDAPLYWEVDISDVYFGNDYIENLTGVNIDIRKMRELGFDGEISIGKGAPTVLIVHTDATEEYLDAVHAFLDSDMRLPRSVASVGDSITSELNRFGISTVHCGAIHGANGGNAEKDTAETIRTMLKIYPSVKLVVDVGRLDMSNKIGCPAKTVSNTEDCSAQIKISVSLWGSGDGREDNMLLALQLRDSLNDGEKRLCAPICLTENQYGSALSRYYLKVDVGAGGNLTSDAISAGRFFARAIADTFND